MRTAKDIFTEYLSGKNLRATFQRSQILDLFLKTEKHVTTEEFYNILKSRNKSIGWATIYRTLKHICEAEIAREIDFGDGVIRYEHKFGHEHHDHMVCTKCGKFIEITNQEIEDLQSKIAQRYNFTTTRHRLEIFGICSKCNGEKR